MTRSTKDLGMNTYLVEMPMRHPLTTTQSLVGWEICLYDMVMRSQPTTVMTINPDCHQGSEIPPKGWDLREGLNS